MSYPIPHTGHQVRLHSFNFNSLDVSSWATSRSTPKRSCRPCRGWRAISSCSPCRRSCPPCGSWGSPAARSVSTAMRSVVPHKISITDLILNVSHFHRCNVQPFSALTTHHVNVTQCSDFTEHHPSVHHHLFIEVLRTDGKKMSKLTSIKLSFF